MRQFAMAMLPRLQRARLVGPLSTLFGALDAVALQRLEAELSWIHLRNGETLFRQGEPGASLYIVIIGRLHLVSERDGATPQLLGEVGRGESVGEQALLTAQTRSATAYAVRDTYAVQLSRASFEQLVDHYPRFALRLSQKIVTRLEHGRRDDADLGNSVATIAVMPAGDTPTSSVARDLATALAAIGPTLHLHAGIVDQMIGKR